MKRTPLLHFVVAKCPFPTTYSSRSMRYSTVATTPPADLPQADPRGVWELSGSVPVAGRYVYLQELGLHECGNIAFHKSARRVRDVFARSERCLREYKYNGAVHFSCGQISRKTEGRILMRALHRAIMSAFCFHFGGCLGRP